MKKLLNPKNDLVFKLLFSTDEEILADLINCVLAFPEHHRITSAMVKNPVVSPEEAAKKFIILDIHAIDETGREFDIEMQVRKYAAYPRRAAYYLCRLYAGQLNAGDEYGELKPAVGIHFLDFELFPESPDFHYRFMFRDEQKPEIVLTNDLALHIIELPVFERKMRENAKTPLREWLRFFNHADEEGETMKQNAANPMIRKAVGVLEGLSADEKTRLLAEMREKALKDEATFLGEARREGFERGRAEGKSEGKIEMARNLLKMGGISVEKIALAAGLTVVEVQKLAQEIEQS